MGRGCGDRVQGGIYAEVALAPTGKPIEHFLLEPTVPVPESFELPAIGTKLMEQYIYNPDANPEDAFSVPFDGPIWHIADLIGANNYPYPVDWIEETRVKGASRRLSPKIDFSKLNHQSRMLFAHTKARIVNPTDYYAARRIPICPKRRRSHRSIPGIIENDVNFYPYQPDMCAGLWWHDLPADEFEKGVDWSSPHVGGAFRIIGDHPFVCWPRPEGLIPQYETAFFCSLPLTRLVVVKGNDHEINLELAREASIEVTEVDN